MLAVCYCVLYPVAHQLKAATPDSPFTTAFESSIVHAVLCLTVEDNVTSKLLLEEMRVAGDKERWIRNWYNVIKQMHIVYLELLCPPIRHDVSEMRE
jgi:hypothetical protein